MFGLDLSSLFEPYTCDLTSLAVVTPGQKEMLYNSIMYD